MQILRNHSLTILTNIITYPQRLLFFLLAIGVRKEGKPVLNHPALFRGKGMLFLEEMSISDIRYPLVFIPSTPILRHEEPMPK